MKQERLDVRSSDDLVESMDRHILLAEWMSEWSFDGGHGLAPSSSWEGASKIYVKVIIVLEIWIDRENCLQLL